MDFVWSERRRRQSMTRVMEDFLSVLLLTIQPRERSLGIAHTSTDRVFKLCEGRGSSKGWGILEINFKIKSYMVTRYVMPPTGPLSSLAYPPTLRQSILSERRRRRRRCWRRVSCLPSQEKEYLVVQRHMCALNWLGQRTFTISHAFLNLQQETFDKNILICMSDNNIWC